MIDGLTLTNIKSSPQVSSFYLIDVENGSVMQASNLTLKNMEGLATYISDSNLTINQSSMFANLTSVDSQKPLISIDTSFLIINDTLFD